MRPTLLRLTVLIAIALIATACSTGTPASPVSPASSAAAGRPLPAGTYTSNAFARALTFTLREGWEKAADSAAYLQLRLSGDENVGIHVFKDPVALSQDASCPLTAEPGVGRTSFDLVKWIRERPGLIVSQPGMATIGGLNGTVIDIGIVDGWKASCPFANGLPTVPLFFQPPDGYRWVVAGDERLRLHVLDVPGGGLVIVDIDAFDGTRIDALLKSAAPIVSSFSFATP